MPKKSDKKEKLVDAAGILIHQQGYGQTSLADIANESGVPLGNVYYYFKTKEELVAAVIERKAQWNENSLNELANVESPRDRLKIFLKLPRDTADTLTKYGCPVGSLCQELDKTPSPITDQINDVLNRQIEWTQSQFKEMGLKDARGLSQQFIGGIQGAILIANTLNDAAVITAEIDRLNAWLDAL